MGGQLARSRGSVIAEVDAFVRFEVSLLSGVSQTITCMPTDTLFMLHDRIVGCLDIADADVLLQFLVREKDHGGHLVEETTAAAELSGCQVTVVVNREPDCALTSASRSSVKVVDFTHGDPIKLNSKSLKVDVSSISGISGALALLGGSMRTQLPEDAGTVIWKTATTCSASLAPPKS
mmetsp:Transcript_51838/g.105373  ORF Transcript_51838/g.105373 Transcript_51838/m.105373 type:complete len:178 (+) Transcript_51838:40-573(+)